MLPSSPAARLAILPVALLVSLSLAACGGGGDEASKTVQDQGTRIQQEAERLRQDVEKAAEEAARKVPPGPGSAEEVRQEFEKKADAIRRDARGATKDAGEDAARGATPDGVEKALDDARRQFETAP